MKLASSFKIKSSILRLEILYKMFTKYTIYDFDDNVFEVEIISYTYSDRFLQCFVKHDFKAFNNFLDLKNFVYSKVFDRSFSKFFSSINDFPHLRTFILNICKKFPEFKSRVDIL